MSISDYFCEICESLISLCSGVVANPKAGEAGKQATKEPRAQTAASPKAGEASKQAAKELTVVSSKVDHDLIQIGS